MENNSKTSMHIYIDGACQGNPGVGGWGAFVQIGEQQLQLYGHKEYTTNNQMELQAAISALRSVLRSTDLHIFTDSQYLKQGIETWIHGWKARGWKTAAKQPVKNKELWQQLDALNTKHKPTWLWVKGHSGNYGNEMADGLANKAINLYKNR